MIDNIRVVFDKRNCQDFKKSIKIDHQSDQNTSTGHIKNMKVRETLGTVTITGSLAKYLNGENMSPLSREQVGQSIELLAHDTGLDFSRGVLSLVEVGSSFIVKKPVHEYLDLFGSRGNTNRLVIDGRGNLEKETVTYTTPKGAYSFTAYNKTREMTEKGLKIPAMFEGCNVLRLEYKITQTRGIKAKFGRNLSIADLCDKEVYRKLTILFYEYYKSIEKLGRTVYIDTSKTITSKQYIDLAFEQYRQYHNPEYLHNLAVAKETGAINQRELKRLQDKGKKNGKDYSISDKNSIIAELDSLVRLKANIRY